MKKKICIGFVVLAMLLSSLGLVTSAADTQEIVILFESDVHCSVDGYAKIAALKDEISDDAEYVGVVTSGDFVQGGSLGIVSKGEYIINIMNLIGYDAVGLGNHEFDYKTERLHELVNKLDSTVVCSNYKKIGEEKSVFNPYIIVPYGDTEVAYIGIITPDTLTSSSPAQFKNEEGQYTYSFCADTLYENTQKSIDAAKKEGADYIIALAHLGTEYVFEQWSAQTLIQNTTGLDVVLDGHSHSVVEGMVVNDKAGNDVIVASTGTGFANIGKLTLSDGAIKTELVPTQTYEKTDEEITKYIATINEEYAKLGERKIGVSEVSLTTLDEQGNRIIRNAETNLGDFCADAYREITGADIGFINGGGIRNDIDTGDITFNEILGVFPFANKTCISEVTGQQIVDMLEYGLVFYPEENGSFQHVSGIKFDFDPQIKHSVMLDENQEFVSVEGARRVSDVEVLNQETGAYEPIVLDKKYTLASHSYLLMEYGGGATMFKGAKLLSDTGILDVELLESYITENLNGVIGGEYAQSQNRINILDEYIPLRKSFEEKGYEVIWNALEPKKIIVKTGNSTVIFMADTNVVTVDENIFESDRIAYIENGRTYISADCLNFCK
ncbi:MAG: 5'-nucleotidase C-terminal domain-containing protein [Clostridia bacterium]|nr:5'-nucleotidase C-terminal domain-containing protein [Clostridia bacterium]